MHEWTKTSIGEVFWLVLDDTVLCIRVIGVGHPPELVHNIRHFGTWYVQVLSAPLVSQHMFNLVLKVVTIRMATVSSMW